MPRRPHSARISGFWPGPGCAPGPARASEAYGLIVGAKGSPTQLVLNTVFFQDTPVGNVSNDFSPGWPATPGWTWRFLWGWGTR